MAQRGRVVERIESVKEFRGANDNEAVSDFCPFYTINGGRYRLVPFAFIHHILMYDMFNQIKG